MNESTIRLIWSKFTPEGKNMPYAEFRKEMKVLTDPVQMQKDLADIELQKAQYRTNKIRIDKAIEQED